MSNLVEHIRKPSEDDDSKLVPINLTELVIELIAHHQHRAPHPHLEGTPPNATIKADADQLRSVLGHLIQNAQDATPPDGEVVLTLKIAKGNVVLFIQDSGSGMTEEFISGQLFKPFESTKGLTGMGIGAYQAREYIQKLGGNIDVTSEPGIGSCFSVRVPLAAPGPAKMPEPGYPLISDTTGVREDAN